MESGAWHVIEPRHQRKLYGAALTYTSATAAGGIRETDDEKATKPPLSVIDGAVLFPPVPGRPALSSETTAFCPFTPD